MKKYIVTLSKEERDTLRDLTFKGTHKAQKILNAQILLGCDEGEYQTEHSTNEEIARVLGTSMRKIDRVKKRFVMEGMEAALTKKKGSRIYEKKADGDFEAHLVALSCSEPPEGFSRWSLRLLADKVIELGYIDSISHEAVRGILKKMKLNPGKKKVG
jgi:transposase